MAHGSVGIPAETITLPLFQPDEAVTPTSTPSTKLSCATSTLLHISGINLDFCHLRSRVSRTRNQENQLSEHRRQNPANINLKVFIGRDGFWGAPQIPHSRPVAMGGTVCKATGSPEEASAIKEPRIPGLSYLTLRSAPAHLYCGSLCLHLPSL